MKPIDPKDPFRDLRLAVNASRVIGGLCIAFGLLGGLGLLMISPIVGIIVGLFFIVPGILYLVFAQQLQAYKSWAAVVLMVMAVLHTIMFVIQLIANLGKMMDSDRPESASGAIFGLVIAGIFCLVGALLIQYLSRCFGIIRRYGVQPQSYGFQPVMPPSLQPTAPVTVVPLPDTAEQNSFPAQSDSRSSQV